MFRHPEAQALFTLILLAVAGPAFAICPIFPAHLRVGDTAGDAQCTHNTIQEAIDSVGTCPVVIDITQEHAYGNLGFCTPSQFGGCHTTITNKNVTLQGWGVGKTCTFIKTNCASCSPSDTVPLITLDGASSGGSVLLIDGTSNVSVRNLTISHGNTGSGDGGGIDFDGAGSLTLANSTVNLNQATNGGGIEVNGTGLGATLTLQANTQILANTVNSGSGFPSGGGIRVQGNTRLFALQPQTLIGYNHAPNGGGGGVDVAGPARADIGSPGYGAGGVIFGNDARFGGGILLETQSGNSHASVRLFSTDSSHPVRFSQNSASLIGGAIDLIDNAGDPSMLCAMDFRLDGNAAPEGTAITGFESVLFLNTIGTEPDCGFPESAASLGAVACAAGSGCNTIDGNIAQDAGGNPQPGSTIHLEYSSQLSSSALTLRGNTAASAIHADASFASLHNCLIADGDYDGPLVWFDLDGATETSGNGRLINCTIAGNTIDSGSVISSSDGLILLDTIIDQPGTPSLSYTANPVNLDVEYVLSNDTSTLPVSTGIEQGAPAYVDAVNGDYHLLPTSLGIDYAPARGGVDIDGKPQDVDLPTLPNGYGPRDLGAYERQNLFHECGASDSFFCDGFDSTQ